MTTDDIFKKIVNKFIDKSVFLIEECVNDVFDELKNESINKIKKIKENYSGKTNKIKTPERRNSKRTC